MIRNTTLIFARNKTSFYKKFHIQISNEVKNALELGKPVVALESTIISHGMPYPRNIQMALEVEQIVRDNGATPATVAIIDGIPRVGLTLEEIELLGKGNLKESEGGVKVVKASTRDIGFSIAKKLHAATTVASTSYLASKAGIKVFATGGIGGVHRSESSLNAMSSAASNSSVANTHHSIYSNPHHNLDISADLLELARTPMTVVCAGVKSILDIPLTLEVLETHSVGVIGYQTSKFPSFYSNESECKAPQRCDTPLQIAEVMQANKFLGLNNGLIVATKNPQPMPEEEIKVAIEKALMMATQDGVVGAAITPYVLSKVEKITGGKSLESNIALVKNNAKIASQIAVEYSNMNSNSNNYANNNDSSVLVVGGSAINYIGRLTTPTIPGSSNPGKMNTSVGGVGYNICAGLSKKGVGVTFSTLIGKDINGKIIADAANSLGINTEHFKVLDNGRTAQYCAIHGNDGELELGLADFDIFKLVGKDYIDELANTNNSPFELSKVIVADANIPKEALNQLSFYTSRLNKPLFFEPTSSHKCILPFEAGCFDRITVLKPNYDELLKLCSYALKNDLIKTDLEFFAYALNQLESSNSNTINFELLNVLCSSLFKLQLGESKDDKYLVVSLGKNGSVWVGPESSKGQYLTPDLNVQELSTFNHNGIKISMVHIPAYKIENIKDTDGCGDVFCSSLIQSLVDQNKLSVSSVIDATLEAKKLLLSK